jgi:uncharacterized protein
MVLDVGWKMSRYVVPSEVLAVDGGVPSRLVFSTRSCSTVQLPESMWRALDAGAWGTIPPEIIQRLAERQVIVRREVDELDDVITENRDACDGTRELLQVLQPSASCQLGCVYCGQQHTQARMGAGLQDQVISRVRRRLQAAQGVGAGFESILVGWFGGEPLLGMPVIRELSPRLLEVADEYGCSYSARVITNGVRLSPDIALELQGRHHVRHVEITLDGPPEQHDTRRPTKALKPTFSVIFENIKALARDERVTFQIAVRCNVDRANAEGVPTFIDILARQGLQQRISLYFSPVYAWGNDADRRALDAREYADREVEWLARMIDAGFDVDLMPNRKRITCLAVRRDGIVTDATGNEYNCTEVPYVPAYGTPNKYQIAHVSDTAEGQRLFGDWNERIHSDRGLACHSCRMLPVCGGACPKAWAEGAQPCPSAKLNIADRMVLNLAQARMREGRTRLPVTHDNRLPGPSGR